MRLLSKLTTWVKTRSPKQMETLVILTISGVATLALLGYWIFGTGASTPSTTTPPDVMDSGFPTRIDVPVETNPVELPVVSGDRIAIKTEFPVKNSAIVLNVTQQISATNFKVNLADTHYVLPMPDYQAYVFLPSGEPEFENVQAIFPSSLETPEVIQGIFTDVTNVELNENKISFNSGSIAFSGFLTQSQTDDGAEWTLISLVNTNNAGDLEQNWLSAMVESLGPYYSREFSRPVSIESDIVDRTMRLDNQGLALPAPRTGIEGIDNYDTFSVWKYSNKELFDKGVFIATTSTQDIYGGIEALESVAQDIEAAHTELFETERSTYIITTRKQATWSNIDAYYTEGTINGKRIASYIFYNPAKNNYSTVSCISPTEIADMNCEKMLTAISERIMFYKGA